MKENYTSNNTSASASSSGSSLSSSDSSASLSPNDSSPTQSLSASDSPSGSSASPSSSASSSASLSPNDSSTTQSLSASDSFSASPSPSASSSASANLKPSLSPSPSLSSGGSIASRSDSSLTLSSSLNNSYISSASPSGASTNTSFSAEIEQCVIGQLVTFPEKLFKNVEKIDVSDFYFDESKNLFEKLKKTSVEGKRFELALLLSELNIEQKRDLKSCMELSVSAHEFEGVFTRLRELSGKRRLSDKLAGLFGNPNVTISDLERIVVEEKELFNTGNIEAKARKNLDEFIKGVGKKSERIPTGFRQIDRIIGGFRKPSVVHIGARPSTGKTAFSLNIATNNPSKKILFFSLEMSAEMIFERIASSKHKINYGKFSEESLTQSEIALTKEGMHKVRALGKLYIIDDIYNIEGMATAIMEIKPDVVMIDYIQKVNTLQKISQMREKIEYISGELKRVARFNNCVVIALSQLRRNNDRANLVPTMSDLKESGALEADGDYIMLIHRPYVLIKNDPAITPDLTEIIIDKNKFGRTGNIKMSFSGEYQQFMELENGKKPPPTREEISNYEMPLF